MDYDYDFEIVIHEGNTNSTLEVKIYDTDAFEEKEIFVICINGNMLNPNIVNLDEPRGAVKITIVDNDDSKCLYNEEFYPSIQFAHITVAI